MNLREEIKKDINPESYATYKPEFLEDRLVRLFKIWALKMVGEDDLNGEKALGWTQLTAEQFAQNKLKIEIRQRIEESTK
jgi:hypothetical protein